VILYLLKTGLAQIWHDPVVNGINDAQELSKTPFQVTMARVRVWHTLRNHYLTPNFPEIDRFIRSDHTVWLVQLLARLSDASLDYCLERRGVSDAGLGLGRPQSEQAGAARRDLRRRQAVDRSTSAAR
jgi:hypothetical protein